MIRVDIKQTSDNGFVGKFKVVAKVRPYFSSIGNGKPPIQLKYIKFLG